jgi:nitrous oxidase accessory protein
MSVTDKAAHLGMLAALGTMLSAGYAAADVLRVGDGGRDLAATIAAASSGDIVELGKGTWRGPIVVDKTLTLRGVDGAVLQGSGEGTVLRIDAPKVIVEDLTVRGSGKDLGGPDACIFLTEKARAAVIQRTALSDCGFGIWLHAAQYVKLLDNRVDGSLEGHRSNRGNGIHLFNGKYLLVKGNHIRGGRDGIYVSATDDSVIEGNHAEFTRYGVHYMYSYRNSVTGNDMRHNAHGYALMQSRHIKAIDNIAIDNEGRALMFRDAQHCTIRGNRLERNGEGMFFYSSTENIIEDNWVIGNEVGAKIWAGSVRNVVSGNRFIGNRLQIFYVGTKDLVWGDPKPGNYWGDYLGWDQDGDGIGDRPYRVDSFTTRLIHRYPSAALLLRSPALELLSHLQRKLPMLRAATVTDVRPRVSQEVQ